MGAVRHLALAVVVVGLLGLAALIALVVRQSQRVEGPGHRGPLRTHSVLMLCGEVRRAEDAEDCAPYAGDWYVAAAEDDGGTE